jgi:uncharacterized membrane protein YdbT with pleckstrin-like domain
MNSTVIRPSTKIEYGVLVFSGVLILAAVLAAIYHGPAWYAALFVPLIADLKAVRSLLGKRFVVMTLTGSSLKLETGLLNKSTRTLDLLKVQDVRVDQSLLERLFDIGDLTLETAGESGRLSMESVDAPQKIADRILEMAHRRTGEFTPGRSASAEP